MGSVLAPAGVNGFGVLFPVSWEVGDASTRLYADRPPGRHRAQRGVDCLTVARRAQCV